MNTPVFLLPLLALTGLSINADIAKAQGYQPTNRIPVADNTLGTQVLRNNNNFSITGGITRGQNTFHSFQDFSVPTSGVATFANPAGNQSIITRVTGSLFSDINGTINTQGANFLLINPNGVVFGPGTQLNVGRVFAASTANGIDLADGAGKTLTFGVNGAGDGALLSIDPKVIFNASRLNLGGGNGEIKNFGTLQTNNPNQYIGLVGGNVTLDAGKINAPGGRIELGGLSAPGSVEIATEGGSPRLSFPADVDRANLVLNNQARVSVASAGSGDIAITAHNIDLLGDSVIRAGIEEKLGTPNAIGGDINLKATGAIVIDNSTIANSVRTNSQGRAGNVNIDSNSLSLQKQGVIQAYAAGQGDAGKVNLKVAGIVDITDQYSGINSLVTKQATGNAGDFEIEAGSLSVRNSAAILSVSTGKGNSGNVSIKTKGVVSLVGGDLSVNTEGTGKAGNLNVNADSLSMQNGATISASSIGNGNAGNVSVIAKGPVSLKDKNTGISALLDVGGVGQGGNIDINAGSFSLLNGAQLLSSSSGQGNAGKVSIFAKDAVDFAGKDTAIFTTVDKDTIGNSGDIDIRSASLSITNGAQLLASNSGKGNGGNINVQVAKTVNIAGQEGGVDSRINSSLEKDGVGNAGNINIDAGLFFLQDSAQLQSATIGKGNAGNVRINSIGAASLSGKSAIFSTIQPGGIGKAGDIDLNLASLSITDGSQILASSNGIGDSGSINVKTSGSVFLSGFSSQIKNVVNSGATGNAGNINVSAGSVVLQNGASLITASNGKGNGGNINVIAKDAINLSGKTSTIISSVGKGAIGKGGNIDLQGSSLSLIDGTFITATNDGIGDSGNVKVKMTGLVDILGTKETISGGISSAVTAKENLGNSGGVSVESDTLSIQNGASIIAANLGKGNAGNIDINIAKSVFLSGIGGGDNKIRGMFVTAIGDVAESGNITIASPQIVLENGFHVDATSISGIGGDINIGDSSVSKGVNGQSNDFSLFSNNLIFLRNGSTISTDGGVLNMQGGGGNIKIKSNLVVALPRENSDITANAIKGRGGNVDITTQGLLGTQFRPRQTSSSDITASSAFGQSGSISINTPGIDPGKDTSKLPTRPIDASKQITQRCSSTQEDNQFYVTGHGGHPSNTSELLNNDVVWLDPRTPSTQSIATNPIIQQAQQSPQPAVGWAFNGKGKVTLLTPNHDRSILTSKVTCPTIQKLSSNDFY
jgi:filamentous hemagglutinin family protein